MINRIQKGKILQVTNGTGSTVTAGSGILVGTKVGVATVDIANSATGSVAMDGVFNVTKLSTDAVTQGAALYWDNTNKRLTTTSSGNTYAGYAAAASGSGTANVNIALNW